MTPPQKKEKKKKFFFFFLLFSRSGRHCFYFEKQLPILPVLFKLALANLTDLYEPTGSGDLVLGGGGGGGENPHPDSLQLRCVSRRSQRSFWKETENTLLPLKPACVCVRVCVCVGVGMRYT